MTAGTLDFSTYIADRTKNFTGREWVFAAIDQWLADPEASSFFIITGEPGVGKSAIAARLTQVRKLAAYHFCIARQADMLDPVLFARSLSLQLCQIDGFALGILKNGNVHIESSQNIQANYGQAIGVQVNNLLINAPVASDAFIHAVTLPLKTLYTNGYDQQLVILIDSLDEAIQYKGKESIVDILANMGHLPPQVRFVLTSRPENTVFGHFESRQIPYFRLDADRMENRADLKQYVHDQVATSAKLQTVLKGQKLGLEDFAERVTSASQGNFLYLVWLLPTIENETQHFDSLAKLPIGLDGIYREFLLTRGLNHATDRWRLIYRLLLGVLSIARTPLTLQQLAAFSGLQRQVVIDCLADLRQFLDSIEGDETHYQLYHQSLTDFFSDSNRAQNFQIDLPACHKQIIAHYNDKVEKVDEAQWEGVDRHVLDDFTSHLWGHVQWEQVDDYGLRYLTSHLQELSEEKKFRLVLYGLICKPFMQEKYQRYQSLQPFATDVAIARNVLANLPTPDLVLLVRLCLIHASIVSQAASISAEGIAAFAWVGQVDKALGLAKLQPEKYRQSVALMKIGEALLFNKETNKAKEVLESAKRVVLIDRHEHTSNQIGMLLARACLQLDDLEPALSQLTMPGSPQWQEMLNDILATERTYREFNTIVASIAQRDNPENRYYVTRVVAQVIDACCQRYGVEAAITVATQISDHTIREQALSQLADLFLERNAITEALVVVRKLTDEDQKGQLFAKIAENLIQQGALDEAIGIAREISEGRSRTNSLSQIALRMAQSDRLDEALLVIKSVDEQYQWYAKLDELLLIVYRIRGFEALSSQIAALATNTRQPILNAVVRALTQQGMTIEAISLVERVGDENAQQDVKKDVALALAETAKYEDALSFCAQINADDWQRKYTLGKICEAMIRTGDVELAVAAAEKITDHAGKIHLWILIAQQMTENGKNKEAQALFQQAWQTTQSITNDTYNTSDKFSACLELATAYAQNTTISSDSFAKVIAHEALTMWKAMSPTTQSYHRPSRLIILLFQLGDLEQAQALMDQFEDVENKAEVLSHGAIAFAYAGQKNNVESVVNSALELIKAEENRYLHAETLRRLIQALIYIGAVERASTLIKEYSISYMSKQWVSDLLIQMIQEGKAEEVVASINQLIESEYKKATLWGEVLGRLLIQYDSNYILSDFQWISQLRQQSEVMEQVVEWLTSHDKVQDALLVASKIKGDRHRSRTIGKVLCLLIHNELTPMLELSQTVLNPQMLDQALEWVTQTLAKQGKFDLVTEIITIIKSSSIKDAALLHVVPVLAERGETAKAHSIIAQVSNKEVKDETLCVAAIELIKGGKLEDGLSFAREIQQRDRKESTLSLAIQMFVKKGELTIASVYANELSTLVDNVNEKGASKNELFYEMSMLMLDAGNPEGAYQIATSFQGSTWYATIAFGRITDTFLQLQDRVRGIAVLNQAIDTLFMSEDKNDRFWKIGWISPVLFELKGQFGIAALLHNNQQFIDTPLVKAEVLSKIGDGIKEGEWRIERDLSSVASQKWLAKIALFPTRLRWRKIVRDLRMQALDLLLKSKDEHRPVETSSRIACLFLQTKSHKQALKMALHALELAESNPQEPDLDLSLAAIAKVLAHTQQKSGDSSLSERLSVVAMQLQDEKHKIQTLEAIAIAFAECHKIQHLDAVITALLHCLDTQLILYALTTIIRTLFNNQSHSAAQQVVTQTLQIICADSDEVKSLYPYLLPKFMETLLEIDDQENISNTLALVEAIQDKQKKILVFGELAQIFAKTQRFEQALQLGQEALTKVEEIQDGDRKAEVLGQLVYTMAHSGNFESGNEILRQALLVASQSGHNSVLAVLKYLCQAIRIMHRILK